MTGDAVPAPLRAAIEDRLRAIERDDGLTILFAVESGSRAWGFPSPDSDVDVRFVYVRPIEWHLSVAPGRDVYERPIAADLPGGVASDFAGWDLRKALGLALRSNATLAEWLRSPVPYLARETAIEELSAFCQDALQRRSTLWHYLRLAERQLAHLSPPDAPPGEVKLKRWLYTLRPALALRWLARHPGSAWPPMSMDALAAGCALSEQERAPMRDLIARKRMSTEFGFGPAAPELTRLVDAAVAHAKRELAETSDEANGRDEALVVRADALHEAWVRRCDG